MAYNFLIGDDGLVYEGRGWKIMGAHALHWNNVSYGICLMGDFSDTSPTEEALQSVEGLIQYGVHQVNKNTIAKPKEKCVRV